MSVGSRMPKRESVATSSSMTSGSTVPPGRTCSAISRASARSSCVGRRRVGELGDALDAVAQQLDVAAGERDEDVDDRRLLDRVEATDGAEVDEPERAVGEGEDVARVRVGVEEAEPHDLVEGRRAAAGRRAAVDRRPASSERRCRRR